MPTAYALGSFRNAIKPVGEQIIVDYNNSQNIEDGDTVYWDYDVSSNYIVSDLEVVKTALPVGANEFVVEVIRLNSDGSETPITSVSFGAGDLQGSIQRAALFTNSSSGSLVSRLVGVKSQSAGTTPSSNSQQSIRIKLTGDTARGTPGEMACLIKVSLARFSDVNSAFDEVVSVS